MSDMKRVLACVAIFHGVFTRNERTPSYNRFLLICLKFTASRMFTYLASSKSIRRNLIDCLPSIFLLKANPKIKLLAMATNLASCKSAQNVACWLAFWRMINSLANRNLQNKTKRKTRNLPIMFYTVWHFPVHKMIPSQVYCCSEEGPTPRGYITTNFYFT